MEGIQIEYEIKKIIYRNIDTGYTLVNVKIKKHPKSVEIPTSETIVRGNFGAIHPKDEFMSIGYWKDFGEHGYQFKSEISKIIMPETDKGVVSFLHKFATGVGPTVIKRVVEKYGSKTFSIIRETPDEIRSIKGMTDKKVSALHQAVTDHRDFEDVAFFLMSLGLNYTASSDVYELFGYSAIQRVKENPYILIDHTKVSFKEADKLACSLKLNPLGEDRIKYGILQYINSQMRNKGDIFVYRDDIIKNLECFLNTIGSYEGVEINEKLIKDSIEELIALKKLTKDYTKDSKACIYFSFYHHVEVSIVNLIKKLMNEPSPAICLKEDIDSHIRDYEAKTKGRLAGKQRAAVKMAILNRISILTGGPGTGKTHTINSIINVVKSAKPGAVIDLCAPTGRAAKRMTEMTNMPAQTIHRLIGLNGFEEDNSNLQEVDADILIVDESSMIDAFVFYSLLTSVSETTRILIVGDHEQLPSVGPGLILRDLIETGLIPVTILDEIFRQAQDSQIVMNSHKLIKGYKTTDINGLSFDHSKGDFFMIEKQNKEEVIDAMMRSIDRLLLRGERLDDIQVLSVMNRGDLGILELNRRIQKRYNKSTQVLDIGETLTLKVGDRIMHTTNNYDLNVFNGEIGKIEKIDETEDGDVEVIVDFGDRDVVYNWDTISEITLAYAMTVHKSQGSEFKNVIMPIHSSLEILLNRNIVYTGWTRAKSRVVLVGSLDELNKSVDRTDNTIRNSMIKERLIRELTAKVMAK